MVVMRRPIMVVAPRKCKCVMIVAAVVWVGLRRAGQTRRPVVRIRAIHCWSSIPWWSWSPICSNRGGACATVVWACAHVPRVSVEAIVGQYLWFSLDMLHPLQQSLWRHVPWYRHRLAGNVTMNTVHTCKVQCYQNLPLVRDEVGRRRWMNFNKKIITKIFGLICLPLMSSASFTFSTHLKVSIGTLNLTSCRVV
jgi:hypothetical protein